MVFDEVSLLWVGVNAIAKTLQVNDSIVMVGVSTGSGRRASQNADAFRLSST